MLYSSGHPHSFLVLQYPDTLHSFLLFPLHLSQLLHFVLAWGGHTASRFLRARKFDVPKAKAMLLSAEQWRKDEKVDELVQCV